MINLHITPQPEDFPKSGGVREHLFQLYKFLNRDERINLVRNPRQADIVHVESAWPFPNVNVPSVYVCHGGFLPQPLRVVTTNLIIADKIVSVSSWIVDRFFPQHSHKTVVIPNGIDLEEFQNVPESGFIKDYILYAKDYDWYFDDFVKLANAFPKEHFMTVYWPSAREVPLPANVSYVGQLQRDKMRSVLRDCKFLLLTGSEVCPTMLLEAWACGKPVFAKNIDGNKELMLATGQTVGGILYSKSNMFDRFNYMLKSKALKEDGIPVIRDLAKDFDWKYLADRYYDVYEGLLA